MVTDSDPDYRDTNARLAAARRQQQLDSFLAEAYRLHRAGQWAAVIKVGEQLQAIDPAAADPAGLITSAYAELATEQQAAKLAADYHTALRLFDAGRWEQAIEAFEHVTQLDSGYDDATELLNRARRELEQAAAALAEEQAKRDAEEQTKQQAEEQTKRQAEERLWRDAEERVLGRADKRPTEEPVLRSEEPAELQTWRQAENEAWSRSEEPVQLRADEPARQCAEQVGFAEEVGLSRTRSAQGRQESRKSGRWMIRPISAALLVAVTIIVVVANGSSSGNQANRLLSHLPAAERSTCLPETPSQENLAQVSCSTSIYALWRNAPIAKEATLYLYKDKGDCRRFDKTQGGRGLYQDWAKDGMSGTLTCYYVYDPEYDRDKYVVAWSIDRLRISGYFSTDGPAPSTKDYQDVLSEALRVRDGVT
jgi:tetratricopeptide (TPR) repeat protein